MQQALFTGNAARILSDEQILSVSELSGMIKSTVEKNFMELRVQGEISGLKFHASGHTYFSLKDNHSVINAICWKGTKLSFALEEGVQIVAKGRVTTYSARSQYQFIVEEASIAGEGALLKLLNERRKKFQEMGYFDRKRKLPNYPQIIGMVTSQTGAVLQDMLHRLRDRYQFCLVRVWPVNVQGAGAAEQVATAVRGFNLMTEKRPDVLIVARGGGSIEDLWPFNEEIIIKAVFDSRIPVISAIGHETDTTLIDYASDLRAPTPTAAIELCTPVMSEVISYLTERSEGMRMAMGRILRENSNKVAVVKKSILACKFLTMNLCQRFDELCEKFTMSIRIFVNMQQMRLSKQKITHLEHYFSLKKQQYDSRNLYLSRIQKRYLDKYNDLIKNFAVRLEQSSYRKILAKGFCFVTTSSGKSVKRLSEFEQLSSEPKTIHFYDGTTKII